jgi:flavodoxin
MSAYEESEHQENFPVVNNGKVLVAYFSHVNNVQDDFGSFQCEVKRSAETAALTLGGDLHPLMVADKYPFESGEWLDRVLSESSADITLISRVEEMKKYEFVVLVYGLWGNYVPMPMIKFLESYDFRGKTIICVGYESFEDGFIGETRHISLGAKIYHIELESLVNSEKIEQQEQALAEFLQSIVDA